MLSDTNGWPIWVSGVRPGREHDTTCARKAKELMPALEQAAAKGLPTPPTWATRDWPAPHSRCRSKGSKMSNSMKASGSTTYSSAASTPSPNAPTLYSRPHSKPCDEFSVCPWRIGAITKAALVLLHLEYGRPLPTRHAA